MYRDYTRPKLAAPSYDSFFSTSVKILALLAYTTYRAIAAAVVLIRNTIYKATVTVTAPATKIFCKITLVQVLKLLKVYIIPEKRQKRMYICSCFIIRGVAAPAFYAVLYMCNNPAKQNLINVKFKFHKRFLQILLRKHLHLTIFQFTVCARFKVVLVKVYLKMHFLSKYFSTYLRFCVSICTPKLCRYSLEYLNNCEHFADGLCLCH